MCEVGVFTCGHSAAMKPGLFGRGQARAKRVREYFGRKCLQCARERCREFVGTLTTMSGQPLPMEIQKKIDEKLVKILVSYGMTVNEG